MSTPRSAKLNSEFQKNIYEVLSKSVKDPRITEMFSVVKVDTDKELTTAKVFISVYSTDKQRAENTFEGIKSAAGFVRRELYKVMRIRTVPQLIFIKDETLEYSDKINKILNEIQVSGVENDDKDGQE